VTRVLPGGTVGIIGSGQLGRMMALEARRMGYRIAVLGPDPDAPAAQLADVTIPAALDDLDAARALARESDVITLDTEHVPADLLEALEAIVPVRPSAAVLRTIQDRLAQRRFLSEGGLPQPRYAAVTDGDSLQAAAGAVGFPCVLKTRRAGYDGKGQVRARRIEELQSGWAALEEAPCVLEEFVDFEREISAILARDLDGNVRFYPAAENVHRRHILHVTRVPAGIPPVLANEAAALGERIATALGHVGTIAVELFVTRTGGLLVNEIAPRTHNSAHYTLGACATSQFEQHIRAVCGLPLGDPALLRHAVMLNLLGDLWAAGQPDWRAVLAHPQARLHLYGKKDAFPGRKMGHILILDDDVRQAAALAESIFAELERGAGAHAQTGTWT